jgi:hypothetical protein
MPDIKHVGYGSLTIQVSDNNKIELGPRETTDISADDLAGEGIQKALRDGLIVILPGAPAEKKPKPKSQNPN